MHSIPKFNGTDLLLHRRKNHGIWCQQQSKFKSKWTKNVLILKSGSKWNFKRIMTTYLLNFFTVLLHKRLIIISSFNCQLQRVIFTTPSLMYTYFFWHQQLRPFKKYTIQIILTWNLPDAGLVIKVLFAFHL